MNNSKGLLILCLSLATIGVDSAWGDKTIKVTVGVYSGKGTATGTVYQCDWWSPNDESKYTAKGSVTVKNGESTKTASGTIGNTYNSTGRFTNSPAQGYTFTAWCQSDGTQISPSSQYDAWHKESGNQSATAYAKFTANQYTVVYDADGGIIDGDGTKTISETYDGKYSCPTPSRAGWLFEGWFTSKDGKGSQVTSSTDVKITSSQTLYAYWVSKHELTVDCNPNIKVEEYSIVDFKFAENPSFSITNVNINSINNGDGKVIEYDAINHRIIAHNAGAARITFTQEETANMKAGSQYFDIIVTKHIPTFTWSNATLYHNQTYNDFFITNSSNALSVKSSSDIDVAYFEDGSNSQKLNLKTLSKKASTTLTVTQDENYKWLGKTESKAIIPGYASNHVTFALSEANYGTFKAGEGGATIQWKNGGIQCGSDNVGSGATNWDDKYIILHFSGIPDRLTFNYSRSVSIATDIVWYADQSSDGNSWTHIDKTNTEGTWEGNSGSKDFALNPTTRYIKLCYSGNYGGLFTNIKVTELKTFSTSVNKLDFGNDNKVGVTCESQTFKFNYANVGHKVTLSTNDSRFTVSPSSITSIGGEQYGDTTITVTYNTDAVHTASGAKLTISDELNHSTQIDLVGKTTKKIQTITWNAPYNVAEPAIPIGKTITGAASASSQQGVTYKTSDPTIIEIVDDGKAFKAIAEGPATITAIQVGTEDWEADSISKTFKGTNKIIQVISWNQNFTRLLTTSSSQDLTAVVNLEDGQTGEQTYNKERSDLITYTSQNPAVVSVSGSTLTIVGVGETTLTATAPGDDLYESATVTIPVKVRVPSAGCEDVMLGNDFGSDEHEFFHYSLTEDMEKVVAIDRTTSAIPGALSFQHKGKKWAASYSGTIVVYESTNNGQSWNYLGEITPTVDKYNTQTYSLNRNATHIKFFRGKSAKGYHYIKNVEISPAQFIESNANNNAIDFGNVTVNSVEERTVTLSYANVKDNLTITKSSSNITLSCGDIIDLDCGATGTTEIKITFAPEAVGDFSDDIQFLDKKSNKIYTLHITAKIEKSSQHITWEPTQTEYRTIDQIELNATASSLNAVKYYVYEGNDVADFTDGVLTIKKDGKVTIRAYSPADALWAAAADVDKIFTIRKTNLHFDPLPTAATITYPQVLSESALTNGVVKDEDGKVVAGTIAWTNSTAKLNADENQSQGIIFTPETNTAWYNDLASTINVTVLKATPDATASAGDIVYGAKVKSSVLTNTGTTEGTWAWKNDEQNEKVLAVGTHEGLKVHFTPKDQTNYNEKDGTVSLTVTAATPTLTWTAKAETATVLETKTFTASSTNTDNTAAITYSIISGGDCATINETTGEVTMLKAGTITVQTSQAATTNFAAPSSITTTCTISKAPTTITTNPTVGDVVYGTALNKIELVGGVAQNTVNNQSVEGTFAITSGDISTAGEHSITVTFTPANTDMYAPCTKDISVTVQKATPNATASAGDIVYGAKVESSVLTNTGTTEGTWAWTDDKKEQELEVGTHEGLKVHFTPTDQTNYNEIDGTVSLTVNKAAATLTWTTAPTSADVKDQLTYIATSNHSESAITYAITEGNDCATIDANTGVLTITKAGTITVQASQVATAHYEADNLSITTTLTGEFETVFIGNGDWNDEKNWTHGLPTSSNPDVVISGNMTIDESISVGSLTIEANGSVTIVVKGELTVNGESEERDAYGDLFVHNGGNVTIGSEASVTVHDFVIESSIGTQDGTSQSGQVDNGDNVIYTNGAYIDINMDPRGNVDPAQWYGFTVPFQVDAKNGVSRKEGDIFRPCTYGVDYMIAEYDMNQRLSTGKGWKFISDYTLQAGHFYYLTIDGTYNTYRFKAKNDKITIEHQTTLKTNGTGANANWNAVGNTTLTYATISGNDLPNYVQTYINGQSCYQVVYTQEAQFVVGCPFFFQAKENTTMVLSKPTGTASAHYAPRQTDRPICVRIAEEGKRFSDQMYITASEDAQGQYQMGRDLAKAGVGTKSAQLWINAYNQQLCVNDAPLVANQAFYDMSLFIPKAGNYEISLPTTPTNGTLYLTQDGYPIWNLNDAPYVLESGKGTISEYGLMFEATQAAAPTDVQTISGNDNAQKILKEQSIYIYKNGNIFNVTGQKVK
ncbi:MAG: InlB B-repeat-containing protein [Paludibacteraceae bacterium]|nr:InlB B-repeat-containing protein [Paludibacteraceae bacterium]